MKMSIKKKFKKLARNPKAFFADSKYLPIKLSSEKLKNKPQPPKKNLSAPSISVVNIDLWNAYKSMDCLINNNKVIAIFPTGIPYIDGIRVHNFKEQGASPFLLPIWEYCEMSHDMDDFEYALSKSSDLILGISNTLIRIALKHCATAIAFPYNNTPLCRMIILQARKVGLTTLLDLPSMESQMTSPMVDAVISISTKHITRPLSANIRHARALANVGGNDSIHFLFLPARQLGRSTDKLRACVQKQISIALSFCKPTDHLIIVRKRRLNGFIDNSASALLRTKYRKTVLFYDEITDLEALISESTIVHVPEGVPLPKYENNPQIFTYHIDDENEYEYEKNAAPIFDNLDNLIDAISKKYSSILYGIPYDDREQILLRIFDEYGFDIVAVPDPLDADVAVKNRYKHLSTLLNTKSLCYGASPESNLAEVFVQWGAEPNESKERPEIYRSRSGAPRLYIEDGFIRSLGLWTNTDEPTCSIILDTRSVYYDATKPSLLEAILVSDFSLNKNQFDRARNLIDSIVKNKISKYNYAPILDLDLKSDGKRTILLIDQKANDMSIKYGAASPESFRNMLDAALKLGNEVEIIIKQHPCAINGDGNEAHYTESTLGSVAQLPNVHLINFDINPYSLINSVDEVWVVSSGMGFEALLAGKPVRCFGMPFYAGWGLTEDEVTSIRRNRSRNLEEVFYVFYLMLTRYVDPEKGDLTTIEKLIEYFSVNAAKQHR